MDVVLGDLPWRSAIGILACLIASFFFSGAETALTHLSSTRTHHLLESEPGKYGILKFWLDHKRRILAGLLVGNNLVNILCSVLGYRVALHFLPDYAEAVSVFGLTIIILVFAEFTPKALALHFSERIAIPVLRIVWLVDKILYVVAAPLSRLPNLLLRRSTAVGDSPAVTEDEIEYQIRLGHDHSVFEEKAQGDLLMSAVEFSDTSVKEVMVPRTDMFTIDIGTPVEKAIETVIESGHSRVPVCRDSADEIVGLLYAKDLLRHLEHRSCDGLSVTLEALVRKNPFFVPETQKISHLLSRMRRRGQHMAIVVDEFGGTAGLITLEDIIEELVGEIRDEYDLDEVSLRRVDTDTWLADARLSIHDLKDATGIELPDTGEYESVGGFAIAVHGNIPAQGTVIESHGVRIRVVAADDRRVARLEIVRLPAIGGDRDA